VYLVLYIHSELLASVTCDLFQQAITITLLIYMALIEEHSKETNEETLKYATHSVNLSILLSVQAILYNGVLVLSSDFTVKQAQKCLRSVIFWCGFEVFLAEIGKKTVAFTVKIVVQCRIYGGGDEG
jgi:hypothetical protein